MSLKRPISALVLALAAAATLAACGGSNNSTTASTTAGDGATAGQPPQVSGFYDGKSVDYLLTDISTEKDAKALSDFYKAPVNATPKLGTVPDSSLAKLYLFMNGVKGPNPFGYQPNVLDSVPGEAAYSPLWRVYAVTWSDSATPEELKSEDDILAAEKAGELTIEKTPLVKNSPVVGG